MLGFFGVTLGATVAVSGHVAFILASVAGVSGIVSGVVLGRPGTRRTGWLLLPIASIGCGAASSLLLLPWFVGALDWLILFMMLGALLSLVPLPLWIVAYAAERGVGRSRAGSLLDAWDRRRVWFATFACLAASAWIAGAVTLHRSLFLAAVLGMSVAGLLVIWFIERAVRRRLRLVAEEAEERSEDPELCGAELLDLGIGEERWRCAGIYALYQLADGRWYIGARDSRSGALLWHREPPRAHYGTHVQNLTASSERIYLGVNWRLELFDPLRGTSMGVIW